MASVQKKKKS